jgi:serine/threonine protein kinase/Tol biopolymer transport system component
MGLSPGTRLGRYEILSPLGAGGMGEVYRARDGKLDRDVAIKVLPSHLSDDPEALARFEREAKAVAALSHPGILAVHDFGRAGATAFVVMELLDGETLRQRLAEGGLPARKAADYGLQVAHALAAAHASGIVHRDLKPDNIFVTRDGRVKVLDFGLAKRETGAPVPDDTRSPTLAPPTEPGTVMGTVGYMSPEQVRGRPVDARSDIFAFGAVLYEMLSGRRAFQRDTAAETMTAILREDPPALEAAVESLPPALGRVVTHCLEKQREERFQSAHDLAFDLSSLVDSQVRHERVPKTTSGRRVGPRVVTGAVVLLAAALGLAGGRLLPHAGEAKSGGPSAVSFSQLTDQPGVEEEPTLSPDGKSVAYVAEADGDLDVFLLRVGGRNPVNLTADSPADDHQPAFSPDGERIAFRSERDGGGIFVMGSTGESARRLTDFGYDPSWSPDGREIAVASVGFYYPTQRGSAHSDLWVVDVASGRKRAVLLGSDGVQPRWSPHGNRIAYWGLRGMSGQRDLATVAADGSEADHGGVAVTDDPPLDWSPAWSPDGRFLYFSSSRGGTMNLWRVPIDEATGRTLGDPEPVTTPSLWSGQASLSRDGTELAFATLDWRTTLLRVAFDPVREEIVGAPTAILKSTRSIGQHDLSPDGQWVAFNLTGVREDIVVARVDGSQYRRLTDDAFRDRGPLWSPDGKLIGFYSDRSGSYEIWTIRPDGSDLEQVTRDGPGALIYSVWSPDGRRFATSAVPGGWMMFERTATGWAKGEAMPPPQGSRFWPLDWSPDGRAIAGILLGENGGVGGIACFSLDRRRYDIHRMGGWLQWVAPRWLSDSRRLIVRDPRGISVVDSSTWRSKRILDVGGYMSGLSVGITRDDRFITYTETATEGDIWMMHLH